MCACVLVQASQQFFANLMMLPRPLLVTPTLQFLGLSGAVVWGERLMAMATLLNIVASHVFAVNCARSIPFHPTIPQPSHTRLIPVPSCNAATCVAGRYSKATRCKFTLSVFDYLRLYVKRIRLFETHRGGASRGPARLRHQTLPRHPPIISFRLWTDT